MMAIGFLVALGAIAFLGLIVILVFRAGPWGRRLVAGTAILALVLITRSYLRSVNPRCVFADEMGESPPEGVSSMEICVDGWGDGQTVHLKFRCAPAVFHGLKTGSLRPLAVRQLPSFRCLQPAEGHPAWWVPDLSAAKTFRGWQKPSGSEAFLCYDDVSGVAHYCRMPEIN